MVDNLNTHCSETLVRYAARLERIDESALGQKGKVGILKSMDTRKAFLSDRSHRIRFVYLPKHTSWLNQIEIVFGIVGRRVVRRGNFTSMAALKQRLLDFIDYFNRPSRWQYSQRARNRTSCRSQATNDVGNVPQSSLGYAGRHRLHDRRGVDQRRAGHLLSADTEWEMCTFHPFAGAHRRFHQHKVDNEKRISTRICNSCESRYGLP